jgi:hypothetical protein
MSIELMAQKAGHFKTGILNRINTGLLPMTILKDNLSENVDYILIFMFM